MSELKFPDFHLSYHFRKASKIFAKLDPLANASRDINEVDLLATTRFEWSYYTITISLDIFYNLEMKIQIYFQLPFKNDCKMPRFSVFLKYITNDCKILRFSVFLKYITNDCKILRFSVFLKYITNDCKILRFSVFLKHIRQIAGGLQNWVGNSNISFH